MIEPCGTPDVTVTSVDLSPSSTALQPEFDPIRYPVQCISENIISKTLRTTKCEFAFHTADIFRLRNKSAAYKLFD